jgi:hypothetical protein
MRIWQERIFPDYNQAGRMENKKELFFATPKKIFILHSIYIGHNVIPL